MKVGVLSLQGCVEPHLSMLAQIGAPSLRVRSPEDLQAVDRLILPGGESTTMLKLLEITGLDSAILQFAQNHALWGICAGAILLAKKVSHPEQKSLQLIDLHATRNAYGSQLDSFKTKLEIPEIKIETEVDFIRAPKLDPLSDQVKVLAILQQQPVLFQQKRILASAFHTELGTDARLHQYFLGI